MQIELIWEGNTNQEGGFAGGTLIEGKNFANYDAVYQNDDIKSALPVELLRRTSFWIYIESDTTFSIPADVSTHSTKIYGVRSQPGVTRATLATAEIAYFRWVTGTSLPATRTGVTSASDLADWDAEADAVPIVPNNQEAVLYSSTVTLNLGIFSSATQGVEQRRVATNTYYRWSLHLNKQQTTPESPTTETISGWSTTQPAAPAIDEDQETRHLYTSVVTVEGNQVVRAQAVQRTIAQSRYAQLYHRRITSTGSGTTPAAPTSGTLSQWSTTIPPIPTNLTAAQTSTLYSVLVIQNYDTDAFISAGTVNTVSSTGPNIYYKWEVGVTLSTPDAPNTQTLSQWSTTQPPVPAIGLGSMAQMYQSTVLVVDDVVQAATTPTAVNNQLYSRRYYYRQLATQPATPSNDNISAWTTTTPVGTIPPNTWRSNVVLRGTSVDSASIPVNLNPTLQQVYYRWSGPAGTTTTTAPAQPSAATLGQWSTTVPPIPDIFFGGILTYTQLYQSSVTLTNGVFSVATFPAAVSGQLIKYQRRFRTVISSPPVTAPATPTTSTLSQWISQQQATSQISSMTVGQDATLFRSDITSRGNTVIEATSVANVASYQARTHYAFATGNSQTLTAPTINLTNYSQTQPSVPALNNGQWAQRFEVTLILTGGAIASGITYTPSASSNQLWRGLDHYRYVTGIPPVAAPATPTSLTGWNSIIPDTPSVPSGQIAVLYRSTITFRPSDSTFASALAVQQQGTVMTNAYFRWVVGTLTSTLGTNPASAPLNWTPIPIWDGAAVTTGALRVYNGVVYRALNNVASQVTTIATRIGGDGDSPGTAEYFGSSAGSTLRGKVEFDYRNTSTTTGSWTNRIAFENYLNSLTTVTLTRTGGGATRSVTGTIGGVTSSPPGTAFYVGSQNAMYSEFGFSSINSPTYTYTLTTSTSNLNPSTDTTNWQAVSPTPTVWSNTQTYNVGQIVSVGSSFYVNIVQVIVGVPPPATPANANDLSGWSLTTAPAVPSLTAGQRAELYRTFITTSTQGLFLATTPALVAGNTYDAENRFLASATAPATPNSGTFNTWLNESSFTAPTQTGVITPAQGTLLGTWDTYNFESMNAHYYDRDDAIAGGNRINSIADSAGEYGQFSFLYNNFSTRSYYILFNRSPADLSQHLGASVLLERLDSEDQVVGSLQTTLPSQNITSFNVPWGLSSHITITPSGVMFGYPHSPVYAFVRSPKIRITSGYAPAVMGPVYSQGVYRSLVVTSNNNFVSASSPTLIHAANTPVNP